MLFADLKGSMELLADRDPEEARKLLDPVLEHMMEAVHRAATAMTGPAAGRRSATTGAGARNSNDASIEAEGLCDGNPCPWQSRTGR